jgi:uncharacterized protein (TIGR02145 family)
MKSFSQFVVMCFIAYCLVSSQSLRAQSVKVRAGWNLLSLPASVNGGTKSSLFPTASSPAYIFHNGYQPKDTLANGYGYWLKFDSSETVHISGATSWRDTIPVQTGWNMIGALTMPLVAGTISGAPSGIIDSRFYAFVAGVGYQVTDTLQPGKGYWIKAKEDGNIILDADSAGAYAKPCRETPTVTYVGKTYGTVQIGNQCWLKENLDVGTMVNSLQNQTNNSIIEKYCYNNDPTNCNAYGGLYQWDEAMLYSTTEGARGICPTGWHIPTLAEFQTLETTVNNDGNALKAMGQGTGAGAGTNTSGFSALLAGCRGHIAGFGDLGYGLGIWSSGTDAFHLLLNRNNSYIYLNYYGKDDGISVRCVKD